MARPGVTHQAGRIPLGRSFPFLSNTNTPPGRCTARGLSNLHKDSKKQSTLPCPVHHYLVMEYAPDPSSSQNTAPAVFTIDELWLLQSVIRHETPQVESWHFPPASLFLNDQLAEALVRCDEQALSEAAILLTRGDCLVIDHNVPQGAKSAAGVAIGKSVLMKSFRARREIDQGGSPVSPTAPAEQEIDREELAQRIEQWKNRRRRKRNS